MAVRNRIRNRLRSDQLSEGPDYALVGVISIPELQASPWRAIGKRVVFAVVALFFTAVIVYIDRAGYRDAQNNPLSFLDSLYYSAVTLSTTGYGDITPLSPSARLVNILIITPMRVLFLIVLIGTTLEVLTERSRQALKIQRWRNSVRNHTVVIGYGTKGRTAVEAMIGDGIKPAEIVVVDGDAAALEAAAQDGLVKSLHGFGDKTERSILNQLKERAGEEKRFQLATATQYAEALITYLKGSSGVKQVVVAGSYRRAKETIGDLDILITATPGSPVMDRFLSYPEVEEILAHGATKGSVRLACKLQVDVRVVPEDSYGAALQYFTGSKTRDLPLTVAALIVASRPRALRTERPCPGVARPVVQGPARR